jgi:SAM-dependent methyltransferase
LKAAFTEQEAALAGVSRADPLASKCKPPLRGLAAWRQAPLHDFPLRDGLLRQYAPLATLADGDVLEIGPGSGYTAFWLALQVRSMTLIDVNSATTELLRRQLAPLAGHAQLEFDADDLCRPGWRARRRRQFDFIYALDVFEYLPNPVAALQNLASVLRGELMISFPNQAPPRGDGVTWFARRGDLENCLAQAGLEAQIEVFQLNPWAERMYRYLHEWPLALLHWWRGSQGQPQHYDQCWAYRQALRQPPGKAWLHVGWSLLHAVLNWGGPWFHTRPAPMEILGRQVLVRARRSAEQRKIA